MASPRIIAERTKIAARLAALMLLLAAMFGPWFYDSHPAAAETCQPPLVWLGGGLCACLVSLFSAIPASLVSGGSLLWLVCLLPGLPFFSTLLLLLFGQPRKVWILHLAALGLAAALALFLFIGVWLSDREVILWGAGLYGAVTAIMLVGEVLVNRRFPCN